MRVFFLIFKTIIFLFVFVFSINNTQIATVNFFPGLADIAVDAPLILWLLLFFLLGIFVAAIFFFPTVLKSLKTKKSDVS